MNSTSVPPDVNASSTSNEKNTFTRRVVRSSFFFYGIGLAVSLYAGAYIFVYLNQHRDIPVLDTQIGKRVVSARPFTPTGTMLLTLASTEESSKAGIYTFDVASKTLAPLYVSSSTESITAKHVDADSFVVSMNTDQLKTNTNLYQVATYDKASQKFEVLTKTNVNFKRHPAWSSALESLVYSGKNATSSLFGTTNDFNIYVREKDGREREVAPGAMPALTPDGKAVVVLRRDGLYLVDLTSGLSQNIWQTSAGSSWLNMQFAISPKGNYIAWSNPRQGSVYVMKVTSWTPFKGSIVQKINTHAFWPVFSPQEDYLAFEEVGWGVQPSNPRLVIYDLLTPQTQTIYDLHAFDQNRLFVSDWF